MCSIHIKFTDSRNISIAGNFNNWTPQVMNYEPVNMVNYIDLKTTSKDNKKIIFKFVYGDNWFTSATYNTVRDNSNNVNNYIDVENVEKKEEKDNALLRQKIEPQLTATSSNSNEKDTASDDTVDSNDDSDALNTTEDTHVDTTSHGTSDESIYYRIWVWLVEFFHQLFK